MIRNITLRNFRGIKSGSIKDLSSINLFVGPNGSGKSTLLQSVIFLKKMHDVHDDFYRSSQKQEPLEIDIGLSYGRRPKEETSVTLKIGPITVSAAVVFTPSSGYQKTGSADLPEETKNVLENTHILDASILLNTENEEYTWEKAVERRLDKQLTTLANSIYGLNIEGFTYVSRSSTLKVLFSDKDFALNLDNLGSGIQIGIRLFLWALLSSNGILLIEEFDAYQHVSALKEIAKGLCSLAKTNQLQMFLTTHSLETVKAFVTAAQDESNELLSVYQTDLSAQGDFRSAALTAKEVKLLLSSGVDVRKR